MSFFHRLTKTKLMLKRELMLLSEVKQALAAMSEKMTEEIQMMQSPMVISETTEFVTELRKATEALTTEQKQRKRIGIL